MNVCAQRIALAKSMGWHHIQDDEWGPPRGLRPGETFALLGCVFTELPNYTEDLNAMHKVEERHFYDDPAKAEAYEENLLDVIVRMCGYDAAFNVIHASAAQRAEAALRTIGKWEGR